MKRSRKSLAVAVLLGIGLCYVVCRSVCTSAEAPALSHQVRPHEQKPRGAVPTAERVPAHAKPRGPEARAEQERQRRDFVAGLEAKFRDELRDPQWSAITAAAVQTALASNDELRPLAHSVECRSQTCRVELADDGSGKLGKLLPVFALQVGRSLRRVTAARVENARGAATMVLYMSRSIETVSAP